MRCSSVSPEWFRTRRECTRPVSVIVVLNSSTMPTSSIFMGSVTLPFNCLLLFCLPGLATRMGCAPVTQPRLPLKWSSMLGGRPDLGRAHSASTRKKLDCKLWPRLEPKGFDCAVDTTVALLVLLHVLANLREAYFEDIRSPADPGLWAHASSKLFQGSAMWHLLFRFG